MKPVLSSGGTGLDVALAVLCATLSIPVLVVCTSLFYLDSELWRHLGGTLLGDYVRNSLLLMLGTGTLALLWGVVSAWLIAMYRFPLSAWLEWALLLPLAMPAYIVAYSYAGLLDIGGTLQGLLHGLSGRPWQALWAPNIRSLEGASLLLALVLYPYIYLLVRTAFLEQSLCALEVARTLGCGTLRRFFRVALPLARPAMAAGLALVLMETLSDYGTVQYFGVPVFTTGIFRTWFGLGDGMAAAQLSALLLGFVLLLLISERWSRRQQRYHHTSGLYSTLHQYPLSGGKALLATAFCLLPVLGGFVVPVGHLLWLWLQSDTSASGGGFPRLVAHSLSLATMSALLALLLALLFAYAQRLSGGGLRSFALHFAGLGYALPGTVVAIGVLIPFAWLDNRLDSLLRENLGLSSGLIFSGTLFILVFAYLVRYLAVALQTVDAALKKIKPAMDEIARCHALPMSKSLYRIHMPLMRGSLLSALLLVFVEVLKELPATLILRPFNYNTLAVRTYELANEERLAEAALPALSIVAVSIVPVILIARGISRSRPGAEPRR